MSPEIWSILTMGVVILIAIATSNRSLRREMTERINGVRRELSERIDGVQRELSERIDRLSERIDAVQSELSNLRERLGRVEGLLEGLRWTRQRAGKERDDEKHGRALP